MNIRYFMFLSLGIERKYTPAAPQEDSHETIFKLSEPSGSIICRRNILALASILVLAGAAGVDPYNFSIFGLKVSEGRGVWVLGGAAILAHLYWYTMRYHHLTEDGIVRGIVVTQKKPSMKIDMVRKSIDLWANRAAAILTLLSWIIVVLWICGSDA